MTTPTSKPWYSCGCLEDDVSAFERNYETPPTPPKPSSPAVKKSSAKDAQELQDRINKLAMNLTNTTPSNKGGQTHRG